MSLNTLADGQSQLQNLRDARNVPAVLKVKLASIRSHSPSVAVLAFEGVDDKTIYFHWLREIAPSMRYEVIICNGKGRLLDFRRLLARDVTGLKERVYFFIDRDFDGLRGHEAGEDIYVTDRYSVENYIVTREVLDEILRVDLHCHGEPTVRLAVLEVFEHVLDAFLMVTRPHNARIFTSRKLGIENKRPWPTKIGLIATVALRDVTSSQHSPQETIELAREPTEAETLQHAEEFSRLDPRLDYRGKFALMFFVRWLQLLGEDRVSSKPEVFCDTERPPFASNARLPLDSLASKSRAPTTLRPFVESIVASRGMKQASLGL